MKPKCRGLHFVCADALPVGLQRLNRRRLDSLFRSGHLFDNRFQIRNGLTDPIFGSVVSQCDDSMTIAPASSELSPRNTPVATAETVFGVSSVFEFP